MSEKDLLDQIMKSSEDILVPESLKPEAMKKKLQKNRLVKKNVKKQSMAVAAVAVCLIGAFSGYLTWNMNEGQAKQEDLLAAAGQEIVAETESSVPAEEGEKEKKVNAGELYVVAGDYGEVYDVLERSLPIKTGIEEKMVENDSGLMGQDAFTESGNTFGDFSYSTGNRQDMQSNSFQSLSKEAYSKTNLQTTGVDESDIVKTDGSYIYTAGEEKIVITEVRNGKIKKVGEISIGSQNSMEWVLEMYVDQDKLSIIVQIEETKLEQENSTPKETEEQPAVDVCYISAKKMTEVRTYDISDRKNPVLLGTVNQDGYYKTSRKIGTIIYLFTDQYLSVPAMAREEAAMKENTGGWIPLVNGTAIAPDCIYLPQNGEQGLVISSIDVKKPDQIVDNTLIVNQYVDIYVSEGVLYLYQQDNSNFVPMTRIAKFTLSRGNINAVGAVSVEGVVRDTFAINEYQGKLRLLTTAWDDRSAEESNNLYLFDENLTMTGKLTGIARGEEIYAARYLGNMVYFVTYRNTDPLFAVDLTDETLPKILGKLKITGFSEYLHFWGEDQLIGIGYETDPDSGIQKGIKLTMFDISDPASLTELSSFVIKNADYSPALNNYKAVLVDAGENVIGFAVESYDRKSLNSYHLYAWENGAFVNLLTESAAENQNIEDYRGLYIGDWFYLVSKSHIYSFDRKEQYRSLEMLELE